MNSPTLKIYEYLTLLPLTWPLNSTIQHNQSKFMWKHVNNVQCKFVQEKFPLKLN